MDFKTLAEFKSANPTLCESIVAEVISAHNSQVNTEAEKAIKADLEKRAKDTEAKLAESDNKVVTLEAEKKTLQENLQKYTEAELAGKRASIVTAVIKETELPEFALTELFKESLDKVPFDSEKEAEFKEAIKALCTDRKSLIKESAPAPEKKKVDTGMLTSVQKKVSESTGVTVEKGKQLLGVA